MKIKKILTISTTSLIVAAGFTAPTINFMASNIKWVGPTKPEGWIEYEFTTDNYLQPCADYQDRRGFENVSNDEVSSNDRNDSYIENGFGGFSTCNGAVGYIHESEVTITSLPFKVKIKCKINEKIIKEAILGEKVINISDINSVKDVEVTNKDEILKQHLWARPKQGNFGIRNRKTNEARELFADPQNQEAIKRWDGEWFKAGTHLFDFTPGFDTVNNCFKEYGGHCYKNGINSESKGGGVGVCEYGWKNAKNDWEREVDKLIINSNNDKMKELFGCIERDINHRNRRPIQEKGYYGDYNSVKGFINNEVLNDDNQSLKANNFIVDRWWWNVDTADGWKAWAPHIGYIFSMKNAIGCSTLKLTPTANKDGINITFDCPWRNMPNNPFSFYLIWWNDWKQNKGKQGKDCGDGDFENYVHVIAGIPDKSGWVYRTTYWGGDNHDGSLGEFKSLGSMQGIWTIKSYAGGTNNVNNNLTATVGTYKVDWANPLDNR